MFVYELLIKVVMECIFCKEKKVSAKIGETKSCINCFIKWKREKEKCCGPNCKTSGEAVKNLIGNTRLCTKCYMKYKRNQIKNIDILKSLVNTKENLSEKYNPLEKFAVGKMNTSVYHTSERIGTKNVVVKAINIDRNIIDINDEITILKDLKHPNVVMYIESFYTNDHAFIVMEYLPFIVVDLINIKKLESGHIAKICLDTAQGLKHIHDANIIHRDIKTDNLCISYDGTVKLIDFGWSVVYNRKKPKVLQACAGTVEFMVGN